MATRWRCDEPLRMPTVCRAVAVCGVEGGGRGGGLSPRSRVGVEVGVARHAPVGLGPPLALAWSGRSLRVVAGGSRPRRPRVSNDATLDASTAAGTTGRPWHGCQWRRREALPPLASTSPHEGGSVRGRRPPRPAPLRRCASTRQRLFCPDRGGCTGAPSFSYFWSTLAFIALELLSALDSLPPLEQDGDS